MTSRKTVKKPAGSKTKKTVDYKPALLESLDLSRALVNEIDNLMGSNLPPAQVGKVLGDIVSGFSKKVEELAPN